MIQLPDDAKLIGYKMSGFLAEAIYRTADGFEGTEQDFLKAGKAYKYVQIDSHTRRVYEQN